LHVASLALFWSWVTWDGHKGQGFVRLAGRSWLI
jgi:hypothetical protein